MNPHTETQLGLYDYLCGQAGEADRASVEAHLAACAACRQECEELRQALRAIPPPETQPADALPDAFWTTMLNDVDRRITAAQHAPGLRQPVSARVKRVLDRLTRALSPRRRLVLGVASIAIVATSAFVTWSILSHPPETPAAAESTGPSPVSVPPAADARMDSYLRKSRMLLVGLTNMPVDGSQPMDLSAERTASRELADQARALKRQTLDDRSLRLITELEKIQIELANMESRNQMPTIELVRNGIEQKNLLFKIRIREAVQLKVRYANQE